MVETTGRAAAAHRWGQTRICEQASWWELPPGRLGLAAPRGDGEVIILEPTASESLTLSPLHPGQLCNSSGPGLHTFWDSIRAVHRKSKGSKRQLQRVYYMSPHTEHLLHILWWPHRDPVNTEQLYASSDPTEELEEPFTSWQQPPLRENRDHVPLIGFSLSPAHPRGGAGESLVCICVLTSPRLSDSHPSPLSSPFPFSLPRSSAVSLTLTGPCMGTGTVMQTARTRPLSSRRCCPAAEFAPPREQRREQER